MIIYTPKFLLLLILIAGKKMKISELFLDKDFYRGGAPVMEVDVVKGLKAIEELKVEMLKAQWTFQQGTVNGSETETIQGLADIVALSYLLTRRMGFDFSKLDRTLLQRLEEWKSNDTMKLETQWGDLSLLISYLAPEE
jgi:hypothetical protein